MNALELLKEDHEKVKGLFSQFEATESDSEKESIYEKIKQEIQVHTHIEETIFYPALKEHDELEDITLEGIEEHHVVDVLMREIENLVGDSEKFEPKAKVLIENVEHHIEEEEGEMFPKVQSVFSEDELEEMGSRMEEEKMSYQKSQSAGVGK